MECCLVWKPGCAASKLLRLTYGIICQLKLFQAVEVMPTRNVVLTEHQADLVERLVSSGRYQNASEVLREGLRLVEGQEAEGKARIKALRDAARIGIADIDAGRYRTFDSPADLDHHLGALRDGALSSNGRGEKR
jgi:antitoxin ParD1/3/4